MIQEAYNLYCKKLLDRMKSHLRNLVHNGIDEQLEQPQKEMYQGFGLLSSALQLKSQITSKENFPENAHKVKITSNYQ